MQSWIIVKLGGTSVASADCWRNALPRLHEALAAGHRLVVVHSALAGVTDRLEALLAASRAQRRSIVEEIAARHRALAAELGISEPDQLKQRLDLLNRLCAALPARAVSAPQRAQVLAAGEFLATTLFLPFLAAQGLPVEEIDARKLLVAERAPRADPARYYLAARCSDAPDPKLAARLAGRAPVILTQGFVARNRKGETVLLGRGGSDTSAAYLAAKLQAVQLEIWTDVPGLFTGDPRNLPEARLLRQLAYEEATEIAATGAKVLHPRCIGPLARARIPLHIRYGQAPATPGTRVDASPSGGERPKAVCSRNAITVVSVENPEMWHQAGFLARIFAAFKRCAISVDMISTSQTSVTMTLDPAANPLAAERIAALRRDLSGLGEVDVVEDCVAISLVGRRIRTNLHRIAPFLEIFQDRRVYLVSQSANDLNVTFVVDATAAPRLTAELHALLVGDAIDDEVFGPAWQELAHPAHAEHAPRTWWQERREELRELAAHRAPCFVYDAASIRSEAEELRQGLPGVDRIFYAVKANNHPRVLGILHACGLGFECVSAGEVLRVLELFPDISPRRILFTPNFAPRSEYELALRRAVWLTLDNLHPLERWPELFAGREVLLRIDLGHGSGHHRHVRTAGAHSKFGIPHADLPVLRRLVRSHGIRVAGLHTHAGSGILDPAHWSHLGLQLAEIAADFPGLGVVNLGGGLGVRARPSDPKLDLARLNEGLVAVRRALPRCELWLEPGRLLVSEAGVLLTRVTQLKGKEGVRYAGVDTGMNSLLRPALYGAYHLIVNLDRDGAPADTRYTVVGPICESGDVLGTARRLPETREGDVLLIANAGAYGRVMSSEYNLRRPAEEFLLDASSPPPAIRS